MQEICEDLRTHRGKWRNSSSACLWSVPGFSFRKKQNKVDDLPELIIRLVESSLCAPFDLDSNRKNVEAAVQHGRVRFRDGFIENLILEEYDLLSEAIWEVRTAEVHVRAPSDEHYHATDAAISLATRGSLYGYHIWSAGSTRKWKM